jgi:two-component sensor histidine kinase
VRSARRALPAEWETISAADALSGMTQLDPIALRRQLTAFAQFTTRALGETDIDSLMTDACIRARSGLNMSHAKLLEYVPGRDRMLLRAGVGWKPGYVGVYEVAPDLDTPIGHAFGLADPVPIADYTTESVYRYPALLKEHGCVASLNVPVRTDGRVFGVLEVDHITARPFSADDIAFLTGLGNTIGQAIELRRALVAMGKALDEKQLLIREMNHRIKNNLSLVAAMLSLQGKRFADQAVRDELANAVARIHNLALVHDRLQLFSASVKEIDAAAHFRELCEMLRSLLPPGIELTTACTGMIAGDNVESLTLVTNELVTNAAKYAFPDRSTGRVVVGYRQEGAGWRLWVRDDGQGLPEDFARRGSSFGQQLIGILATRVGAEISVSSDGGTTVTLTFGIKA